MRISASGCEEARKPNDLDRQDTKGKPREWLRLDDKMTTVIVYFLVGSPHP